jgi:hypothetical protein
MHLTPEAQGLALQRFKELVALMLLERAASVYGLTMEDFDQFPKKENVLIGLCLRMVVGLTIDIPMMGRLVSKSDKEPSFVGKVYRFFTARWF